MVASPSDSGVGPNVARRSRCAAWSVLSGAPDGTGIWYCGPGAGAGASGAGAAGAWAGAAVRGAERVVVARRRPVPLMPEPPFHCSVPGMAYVPGAGVVSDGVLTDDHGRFGLERTALSIARRADGVPPHAAAVSPAPTTTSAWRRESAEAEPRGSACLPADRSALSAESPSRWRGTSASNASGAGSGWWRSQGLSCITAACRPAMLVDPALL